MKRIFTVVFLVICLSISAQEINISIAAGQQFYPDVATDNTDFYVVWEDARAGTGNPNIYGRIIMADGSTPSVEGPICAFAGYQRKPAVGFGSAYYLSAWSDQRLGGNSIYGNLIQPDGTLYLANFEITTVSGTIQKIVIQGNGDKFMVVYEDRISGYSTLKACVTGEDMTSTTPVDVSESSANQKNPSIETMPSGWIVVYDDTTGTGRGIYASRFGITGARVGMPYPVTSVTNEESAPAIAYGDSLYLVVFERDGGASERDIYGIFLDESGDPEGVPFPISTASGNQTRPEVSFDGLAFLVVWQDSRSLSTDIYGQRVSLSGTVLGSEIALCDAANSQQKVRADCNGSHYLMVWEDSRNATMDIFGTRLEAATPPSGPVASIIQPLPISITACNRFPVMIHIEDPDGVDESSVIFSADGDTFTSYSPSILFIGDTMRFVPPWDWPSGETIEVCLIDVTDILGNHIFSPMEWFFYADLDPPYVNNEIPRDGQIIDSFPEFISVNIGDSISGLDLSSVEFIFDHDTFTITSPGITWDSYTIRLYPLATADSVGTHSATIIVGDSPDYCTPNRASYSWDFFVNPGGAPNVSSIRPKDGDVVASPTPDILVKIKDDDGIDTSTIELTVACSTYYWPEDMVFEDSILTYTRTDPFIHGASVVVVLENAADIYGNYIETPLSLEFQVDIQPPNITELYPVPGDTLDVGTDDIWIIADDVPAGIVVNPSNVDYKIYDLSMALLEDPSGGLTSRGDTVVLQSGAFGGSLDEGSSVNICVEISDNPDVYDPHVADTCWQVYISLLGIDEAELPNSPSIKVVPNPFNASCRIFSPGPVEIFDINGKMVKSFNVENDCLVWNSTGEYGEVLSSGIYFVKIIDDPESVVKIILMR